MHRFQVFDENVDKQRVRSICGNSDDIERKREAYDS